MDQRVSFEGNVVHLPQWEEYAFRGKIYRYMVKPRPGVVLRVQPKTGPYVTVTEAQSVMRSLRLQLVQLGRLKPRTAAERKLSGVAV